MFSPTKTIKISIFQIPPLRGVIQKTPDLQNIYILSFRNFSDTPLRGEVIQKTLTTKNVPFMFSNFLEFSVLCLRGTISSMVVII